MSKMHDAELERAYVANLLATAPEWQKQVAVDASRLEPEHCYQPDNAELLTAAYAIIQRGEDANHVTLWGELKARGAKRSVGEAYEKMLGEVTSPAAFADMAGKLVTLARARSTRVELQRALARIDELDLEGAQDHARAALDTSSASGSSEVISAHTTAWQAVLHVQLAEASSAPNIIRTGFPILDDALRIRPRTMLTVGGRTGCGKSSLMLAMALEQARAGHRPGIVSLEDDRDEWGRRLLAHMSSVNPDELDNEALPIATLGRIELGLRAAQECKVQFAYALNRPVSDVLKAIRSLAAAGCNVVYVDYIQAVRVRARGDRQDVAVSEAAQDIKAECQALGVALVLGSQLKRPDGSKAYSEPTMFELKETGNLENMSEGIIMLWKTGDDELAEQLGKVSKVKGSARRPRFKIGRSEAGAITDVWGYTAREEPPANISRPSFGRRS